MSSFDRDNKIEQATRATINTEGAVYEILRKSDSDVRDMILRMAADLFCAREHVKLDQYYSDRLCAMIYVQVDLKSQAEVQAEEDEQDEHDQRVEMLLRGLRPGSMEQWM